MWWAANQRPPDEQPTAWCQVVAQATPAWAQAGDTSGRCGSISQRCELLGILATYLLDPEGYIVATWLRNYDLERELARLLPKPSMSRTGQLLELTHGRSAPTEVLAPTQVGCRVSPQLPPHGL